MKTTEQKAKAYDEVREKIALRFGSNVAEEIFSEFEDSEDERVRKEILSLVRYTKGRKIGYNPRIHQDKMIAWLEKQGEQKPADKVEPMFHEGEWITCEELNTAKIININDDKYEVEFIDGNKGFHHIDYIDRNFHLWTIQDAKDGDVLASELCDSIIIFSGIKDDNIDFYCDYDFSKIDIRDRFTVNNGQHYGNVEDSKDFHPATKEQRDLLFQKMHEAGYIWYSEIKQLLSVKAEQNDTQNPAWSEEDEERLKSCLNMLQANGMIGVNTKWLKSIKQRIGG